MSFLKSIDVRLKWFKMKEVVNIKEVLAQNISSYKYSTFLLDSQGYYLSQTYPFQTKLSMHGILIAILKD
jgi:hypothetical protein